MTNQTDQDRAGDHRTALESLSHALAREAHVLTRRPDLLWQQLYNRLQWEGEEIEARLTHERQRRSRPGSHPWIHLYTRLRESEALVRTLTGHTNYIRSCVVSPDGTFVVSTSGFQPPLPAWIPPSLTDCTLRIWDVATGVERAILTGHATPVAGCAVSPDGSWIVSIDANGTLKVWDTINGAERATFADHTRGLVACAVSPDGTWIVSGGNDSTLKIWDAATGAERATLAGHNGGVRTFAVSPDGSWIVSAGHDGTLKIWDTTTGAERATLTGQYLVRRCAVSPDGTWIVSAGGDTVNGGTLEIWDVSSGAIRATLTGHTEGVNACAVSPDGTWILSASDDKTLKIWDATTGTERATLIGHTEPVSACAVSPDGAWIVSAGGFDRTLKIWDATIATDPTALARRTDSLSAWELSPDGTWVFSDGGCDTLKIRDAATGTQRAILSTSSWAHRVSPDGTWTVVSDGRDLKILDVATGAERATLTGHAELVNACAVSPDGTWIVSTSKDHTLKIWDAATGIEQATHPGNTQLVQDGYSGRFPPRDWCCAVSPDGAWIVFAANDSETRIWDLATGTEQGFRPGSRYCNYAVSPDGTWIATAPGDDEHTIHIWDGPHTTLRGHTAIVRELAVSPDGNWIVSVSDDNTLRVWNVNTGTERAMLVLPGITTVVMHPAEPIVVCTDRRRHVYLAHLVGIDLGPLVVTASAHDGELAVRCPACQSPFPIEQERLGSEITCPQEGCHARLRANPSVMQKLTPLTQLPTPAVQQPVPAVQQTAPAMQPTAPVVQPPAPAILQPTPTQQPAPRKRNWLTRLLKE